MNAHTHAITISETIERYYRLEIVMINVDGMTDEEIEEAMQREAEKIADSMVTKAEKKAGKYYVDVTTDTQNHKHLNLAKSDAHIKITVEVI